MAVRTMSIAKPPDLWKGRCCGASGSRDVILAPIVKLVRAYRRRRMGDIHIGVAEGDCGAIMP